MTDPLTNSMMYLSYVMQRELGMTHDELARLSPGFKAEYEEMYNAKLSPNSYVQIVYEQENSNVH